MKYKKIILGGKRINSKDLSILCKQFSVLLNAGINISEVLDILARQRKNKKIKKYLVEIYEEVQKGEELGAAMSRVSGVFPYFMIQMVRIGEQSGKLEYIFKSLSDYYHNENNIKKKIKDAFRYPLVVLVLTILVFFFLMTKVVPMFAETLLSLGGKLPAVTKILLILSKLIINNYIIIFLVSFTVFLLLFLYSKTDNGKNAASKLKLKIPFISILYKRILTVKFSKYLNTLLSSGFNVISSMELLCGLMGSKEVEKRIKESIDCIKSGDTLTYSINRIGIFEPLLISMVSVGEESGKLEEMLIRAAEIYEEDINEIIDKGTKLIEPTMIVFLAFFVGTIVLSVVVPMYSIMDNMGG